MQKTLISFVISALVGLGIGYVAFEVIGGNENAPADVAKQETDKKETESSDKKEVAEEKPPADKASADSSIFKSKGCLGCHSISALNLEGGATGPDLSKAFENVEGKHGKPIDQFLKEPTSAVMSGVIGGNPLSEDEISEIVNLLEEASKK